MFILDPHQLISLSKHPPLYGAIWDLRDFPVQIIREMSGLRKDPPCTGRFWYKGGVFSRISVDVDASHTKTQLAPVICSILVFDRLLSLSILTSIDRRHSSILIRFSFDSWSSGFQPKVMHNDSPSDSKITCSDPPKSLKYLVFNQKIFSSVH